MIGDLNGTTSPEVLYRRDFLTSKQKDQKYDFEKDVERFEDVANPLA